MQNQNTQTTTFFAQESNNRPLSTANLAAPVLLDAKVLQQIGGGLTPSAPKHTW